MGSVLVERTLAEHKRTRLIFNLIKQTIVGLFDQCMELDRKYATFTFKLKKSDFKSHWAKVAKLLQPFYKFSIELSMCESVSRQTVFLTDFHFYVLWTYNIQLSWLSKNTIVCIFETFIWTWIHWKVPSKHEALPFSRFERYSKKQKQTNKQNFCPFFFFSTFPMEHHNV